MSFSKDPVSIIEISDIYTYRSEIINKYAKNLENSLFLEFGVASGDSFNMFYDLYEHNNILNVDFYGFDAWKGLPKEKNDLNNPNYWFEGEYNIQLKSHLVEKFKNKNNVNFVNGWFSETLNHDLYNKIKNKFIGIVHIDCDLYTSTIEVLEFILSNKLLKKGSIIIYDDWGAYHDKLGEGHDFECGEGKAHLEMMTKYDIKLNYITKYIKTKNYHEITIFMVE